MVQKSCRGARSLDRIGQDVPRIGSGSDRINVLAENRYLHSLGHRLQVGELWRNSDGHSTISRDLISDFGEFDTPLARSFNVSLEVHKYERSPDAFYSTQPQAVLGGTSSLAREFFKFGNQILVPQISGNTLRNTDGFNIQNSLFSSTSFAPCALGYVCYGIRFELQSILSIRRIQQLRIGEDPASA